MTPERVLCVNSTVRNSARGAPRKLSPESERRLVAAYVAGEMSVRELAEAWNVSTSTVRWARIRAGVAARAASWGAAHRPGGRGWRHV